uniref:Uncharacterized protein n=1 Tax=Oryza glumipatula TaxID=40148 RepID=A0A0D9YQB5_9ORYZ
MARKTAPETERLLLPGISRRPRRRGAKPFLLLLWSLGGHMCRSFSTQRPCSRHLRQHPPPANVCRCLSSASFRFPLLRAQRVLPRVLMPHLSRGAQQLAGLIPSPWCGWGRVPAAPQAPIGLKNGGGASTP